MIQTILITMTIGNPLSNPLHPKVLEGIFIPLLSHDIREDYETKPNHVYNLFEQP